MSRINPFNKGPLSIGYDNCLDLCFGMDSQVGEIIDTIKNSDESDLINFFIYGEPGVGKTSLINMVQYLVSDKKTKTEMDKQEMLRNELFYVIGNNICSENTNLGDVLNPIIEQLKKGLRINKFILETITGSLKIKIPAFVEVGVEAKFSNSKPSIVQNIMDQFYNILCKLFDKIEMIDGSGLVIVLEDIDFLISNEGFVSEIKIIIEKISLKYNKKLILILSGLPESYEKFLSETNGIDGYFKGIELLNLEENEMNVYLDRGKKVDKTINDEAKNIIFKYSGGNISLAAHIANETLAVSNTKNIIDKENVEEALVRIKKQHIRKIIGILKRLDSWHIFILKVLNESSDGIQYSDLKDEMIYTLEDCDESIVKSCINKLKSKQLIYVQDGIIYIINKLVEDTLREALLNEQY